ncbi:galactose-binding domain-like protein [Suillus spraguei]|nr:galactose-binding domain-like protein [Suillus spraguei]
MAYESIPLEAFHETFNFNIELSSVALGGNVVKVSDEFFAQAFHLLEVEPAPSLKGQFGPNGALYNGWESRRHNPSYDWCVIELGTLGTIVGFDIDTTHFNGNEAPEASVDGIFDSSLGEHDVNNAKWTEILPRVPLGPSQRHLFKIPETERVRYVRLNMYPDGGIARFRVYGNVVPVQPDSPQEVFDLAHVFAGGRVTFMSDQHFGVGANLILPGRGKDMGDGWETKRSRQKGHKDWVIIKLGTPGHLRTVEIDTAHFKGNFPETCELHALCSEDEVPDSNAIEWAQILSPVKLGPHRRHFFPLEADVSVAYTHVKLTIYPDGGIKRVRVCGTKGPCPTTADLAAGPSDMAENDAAVPLESAPVAIKQVKSIPVLPLTPEAFSPFGQVIQAYGDHAAAPRGTKITPANQGSATKFHKLSLLESSYPVGSGASSGLSVYRCNPTKVVNGGVELKVVERHPYTNQAFIPMGGGGIHGDEALKEPGSAYLVVVAHNGANDKPDFNTLRAFVASAGQGIMYNTAIWHQPMTVLYKPMDFTCVETQIGNGDQADCEILELEASEVVILALPRH